MKSQRLSPEMREIMSAVNNKLGTAFNGILLNYYADGSETIGAHSDDEKGLYTDKGNSTIASIIIDSDSEPRIFRIRNKSTKEIVYDCPTPDGCLIVMQGQFQKELTHEIPASKRIKEPRWSLTFREHID